MSKFFGYDHHVRALAMMDQYHAGATFAEIGTRYGITRQRVQQLLAHTPGFVSRRQAPPTEVERAARFWSLVARGDKCWEWQGARNPTGYGRFGRRYAHHVGYELGVGPIPDGLWVLHHCDNPPCVRPDHLYAGTASDNARDRERRGRGGQPGFHPEELLLILRSPASTKRVAAVLGSSESRIYQLRREHGYLLTILQTRR